jgi:hypothetical protein
MEDKRQFGYRSLFWPILLIGVGTIWLLANLGILPDISWRFLLRLWPLVLIIIGLDILIGRRSPVIGGIIGLGAVALVIALVLLAPTLDLEPEMELKTLTFIEPLENASSARITLDLERYSTIVDALTDSNSLIEAELDTLTDVNFNARGAKTKTVNIEPVSDISFDFDWIDWQVWTDAEWDIGLSPDVPLDLTIDAGSGSATLNLTDLELSNFEIDGGSGSIDLFLPATTSLYDIKIDGGSGSFYVELENRSDIQAQIDAGSGSFELVIGTGSDFEARIDGGSGSIDIDVPEDAGIRVVVRDKGSGRVRIPSDFDLLDDMDDDDRDTGIWESEDYDDASHKIEITFDPGSGSFELR